MMSFVTELQITRYQDGYRYRILDPTQGAKANVAMFSSRVRASALEEVRTNLSDSGVFTRDEATIRTIGQLLYNLVIQPVPEIERFLRQHNAPLFVSTDDPEMPLELLHDGQEFLGLRLPLGRGIIWSENPPRPVVPAPPDELSMLIIADPTGNLPGAQAEAEALISILPSQVNFKLLILNDASYVNVLRELSQGIYNIIHYAGHIGTMNRKNNREAYIELGVESGRHAQRIFAHEIGNNLNGNPFVYLNGCSSSNRLKGAVGNYTENLARAFIKGGAVGLIGTLWDVPDQSAGLVSQLFYQEFLAGQPAGEALRRARLAARAAKSDDATWAAPIFYGDPTLKLLYEPAGSAPVVNGMNILEVATQEAHRYQHAIVSSVHLCLALLHSPARLLTRTLPQLGFSAEGLSIIIRQAITPGSGGPEAISIPFSDSVNQIVQEAKSLALSQGADVVEEYHLLASFLRLKRGSIFSLFRQLGLDSIELLAALEGRQASQYLSISQGGSQSDQGRFNNQGYLRVESMDMNAQEILSQALREAVAANTGIYTVHLLVALLEKPDGYLPALASQQGLKATRLAEILRAAYGYHRPLNSTASSIQIQSCSPRVLNILELARKIAAQERVNTIGERHLLEALIKDGGGSSAQLLTQQGLDWNQVRQTLRREGDVKPKASKTPVLDKFGRDLTEAARAGKLSPVIGRKKEIEQIVLILSKETHNNPVLVGEAGVGKTAVVEGLAQHIVTGKIPPGLRNRRLVEIPLAALVAGTRYRGEFEERLQELIEEVLQNPELLIFIDEVHMLVGAGDAEGALDAANIFKPALARGDLHCIGATTHAEFQRTIAQDAALKRRFVQVIIPEPSSEETLEILKGLQNRLETYYNVTLAPDALIAAIRFSVRYLPDQRLPDKALDLLEESCARLSLGTMGQWGQLDAEAGQASRPNVGEHEIARVIAGRKGLPVDILSEDEQKRLLELETLLKKRIIGQDEAVSALAKAVRMARTGLIDPQRPGGVFLFVGPTGVGKTELAKALAGELFGSSDELTRLDMSEFMEQNSVAKLIGAPPGYKGYGEEGQLVKALRSKPYSVVLIDEIEKAAPEIFDLFLQLFDEGRLTDSQGQLVDGRQAFYIMTSNIGSELTDRRSLGLLPQPEVEAATRREIIDRLQGVFRPEFLNRIDEIIVFQPLDPDHIRAIAQLQIAYLQQRLQEERGISLEVRDEVIDLICERGYNKKYGARLLKRTIRQLLSAPLSDLLLSRQMVRVVAQVLHGSIELLAFED